MSDTKSYFEIRDENLAKYLAPKWIKLEQLKDEIKNWLAETLIHMWQYDYPNEPWNYLDVVMHNGLPYWYYSIVSHPRWDEYIIWSYIFKWDEIIEYQWTYMSLFKVLDDGSIKMVNWTRIFKDLTPIETSSFTWISIEEFHQCIFHTFEVNDKIYIIVALGENKWKWTSIKYDKYKLYERNDELPVRSEFKINSFSKYWDIEAIYWFSKKLFLFQTDWNLILTDFLTIWNIDIDCSKYNICSAWRYDENKYQNNKKLNTPTKLYLFANDQAWNIYKQLIIELVNWEVTYIITEFDWK